MMVIWILLGSLLFGLILLALGVILFLKLKNKLAGILVMAVSLVLILCPFVVYLYGIQLRVQG